MKTYSRAFIILLLVSATVAASMAQDSLKTSPRNTAETLLNNKPGLGIGGYAEVHYNQPLNSGVKNAGTLDVHRVVMFLGYNFSKNTQFVSEIEFEYAKEIWVEQAFLQQRLHRFINFRAGLLLVPMGIINEIHEPTTFNGVERPWIDNRIAPTTWREIGMGFSGSIQPVFIRYQLYAMNGFNGYDTKGTFNGTQGLREGRQKGSKAYITSPSFTGKAEFYGISNLTLGLSGYVGKSQSRLFLNMPDDSLRLKARADSSVVGIAMGGADVRYNYNGLKLTGQLYYISLTNTAEYNKFTATGGKSNDLGSAMTGWYAEAAYNIFRPFPSIRPELHAFFRYEAYDTHHKVDGIARNDKYNNTVLTTGFTFAPINGAVFKTDIQFIKSAADSKFAKVFNAGIGVSF